MTSLPELLPVSFKRSHGPTHTTNSCISAVIRRCRWAEAHLSLALHDADVRPPSIHRRPRRSRFSRPAFASSRIGSRSGVVRYDKFFCSFSQHLLLPG
nr:uncharacterized protein LOC127326552 isoform X6 [Lolium perenne]